jgi:hypothetical protein
MKRLLAVLMLVFVLSGCKGSSDPLNQAMVLRKNILAGNGCSFAATITADYTDVVYTFSMNCVSDKDGKLAFTVTQPESIAGITGSLSPEGGKLTFDGNALAFPVLADGELTPVSGPYVFLKALRGGYINACGEDGTLTRVSVDDSYEQDALRLDVWLDEKGQPVQADIFRQGRRVLSLQVSEFEIL